MTDKQLAVIFYEKARSLELISKQLREELLKSKKFRKYYKSPFRSEEIPYVPVLEGLEGYINNLISQADMLERIEDGNTTKQR